MERFPAFCLGRARAGEPFAGTFRSLTAEEFDAGDVLVEVRHASVCAREAWQAQRGVQRVPCVGGSDLCGRVLASAAPRFRPGDEVIATSYALGVAHHGGFCTRAALPGGWVLPLPAGLSSFEAMALGSPGLALALAITRLEEAGLRPERGPVLVSGASGGVGSLAVAMLATRGYTVHALTAKAAQADWLRELGAAQVSGYELLGESGELQPARWVAGFDVLGGQVLARMLCATKPGGAVASLGMCADATLQLDFMPFAARGVSLIGVDSVYAGFGAREAAWARLSGDLRPRHLDRIARTIGYEQLPEAFARLLAGQAVGRTVVCMSDARPG